MSISMGWTMWRQDEGGGTGSRRRWMKWTKRSKVQILRSHWFRWLVSSEPSLWRCRSPDRWSPCRFHSCDTNGRKILKLALRTRRERNERLTKNTHLWLSAPFCAAGWFGLAKKNEVHQWPESCLGSPVGGRSTWNHCAFGAGILF